MAENILESLTCKSLVRLDVNFRIDAMNLDSFIGRTAHMLLIECEGFIETLVHNYKELFCE
jgi:hypothetical protein